MKNAIHIILIIYCLLCTKGYTQAVLTAAEKTVALTILAEARGEGKAGMYAVACVIQQRSINRSLTPAQVCKQRKQFSCWNSKKDLSYLLKTSQATYATLLAKNIIGLDLSYTNNADHYCTLKTHNYWTKKNKIIKIIGNHKFYKLK
tara:strand:+ start:120 stop:560 length:441 start_codon:yes stop_codon:yes gene_type:complete